MSKAGFAISPSTIASDIERLGPWFHNLHLPNGLQTAPDHFLGDFPRCKWREIAPSLPEDMTGWRVLDIGCNAGFYSFELAGRGAQVTAIDIDMRYLKQALWAAEIFGLEDKIEFRRAAVYQLTAERQRYDLVWFMGVFYHLRYPLLALDIVRRVCKQQMVFQTMTTPGDDVAPVKQDYSLSNRQVFNKPGWPKMAFIEHCVAGDPTNWWAPNHAGVEAMLRSAGFGGIRRLAHEIYSCDTVAVQPRVSEELRGVFTFGG